MVEVLGVKETRTKELLRNLVEDGNLVDNGVTKGKKYKNRKNDSNMNYNQIEEYILNIPKFRAEGSIEETRKFYEFLGKPGQSASIVHVAGTNGKGSTCAYMNFVLTEAGYRVGMFTSPHLVSVRERMRINHILISEQELVESFEKLEERIADFQNYLPTFYEFLFFMAMLYFEKQNVDIIILETGMGGRLDATNVIDAPKVAVITEIGKDHMEILGDTYELIAAEKAGIIKKRSVVVYSANRQESSAVIERKAKELGVLCKSVEKLEKGDYRFVDKKIDFSFFSRYYGYIPIRLNTNAVYQIENAMLALTAIEEMGVKVSMESLQNGMEKCRWEGRMEEILPNVFLDGAHNEDGIDAFIATVKKDSCRGKRWLLFSAVADKEYILMKEKLTESELFACIYASPLKTARGIAKEELKKLFADDKAREEKVLLENCKDLEKETAKVELENTKTDLEVRISDSAYEGLQEILLSKQMDDFVYVTGSLYLVGEIKEKL